MFSVPYIEAILKHWMPLVIYNYLRVWALTEQAKTLTEGLYLAISLASLPVSVKAMIKEMSLLSYRDETTTEATDSAVSNGSGV